VIEESPQLQDRPGEGVWRLLRKVVTRVRHVVVHAAEYGGLKAYAQLAERGWRANRKAIQRLWREEGLRVPASRRTANA
jgi:hypothetical protein